MRKLKLFCLLLLIMSAACRQQQAPLSYGEITLPSLVEQYRKDGHAIIVDVRSAGEFYDTSSYDGSNIGRLKGSINLPIDELQRKPTAISVLDRYKDSTIYLICSHSNRSRKAADIFLKNGFTKVVNVQGGMSDWFRLNDQLEPYKNEFWEYNGVVPLMSSKQVKKLLDNHAGVIMVGITEAPHSPIETHFVQFYQDFPVLKGSFSFTPADSLKILELARKNSQVPVVLYNLSLNGTLPVAKWMKSKGAGNVYLLPDGPYTFFQYVQASGTEAAPKAYMEGGKFEFIDVPTLCAKISANGVVIVDTRSNQAFTKKIQVEGEAFDHIPGAVNFSGNQGVNAFERKFPDKTLQYIIASQTDLVDELTLAEKLAKGGYKITWLTGGVSRWIWFIKNEPSFPCKAAIAHQ